MNERQQVRVAEALEVEPLPVPLLVRAGVEEELGRADLIAQPVLVGQLDAVVVQAGLGAGQRFLRLRPQPGFLAAGIRFGPPGGLGGAGPLVGPLGRRLRPLPLPDDAAQAGCRGQHDQGAQGRHGRVAPGPFRRPLPRRGPAGPDRFAAQPALQILGQGLGAAVAPGRVPGEARQADRLQIAVGLRAERARPHRVLGPHLQERVQRRVGLEGGPAGEQFVEDGAQGPDVGSRGQGRRRGGLLGGHVARRADDRPLVRQGPLLAADPLGQAEVGDVRLAAGIEEDVGRLEVAVQDAVPVGLMHRPRHRGHQAGGGPAVAGQPRQVAVEAAAVDQLHGEEGVALMPTGLVDGHDVGVIQAGQRPRLGVQKALDLLRRVPAGQDHLEGDDAVEADLAGLEDDTHPAAGDFLQQLVIAEAPRQGVRPKLRGVPGGGVRGGRGSEPERLGHVADEVMLGEELFQLAGQFGVAGEQLAAVGGLVGLGGLEVGRQDFVHAPVAGAGVGHITCHGAPPGSRENRGRYGKRRIPARAGAREKKILRGAGFQPAGDNGRLETCPTHYGNPSWGRFPTCRR